MSYSIDANKEHNENVLVALFAIANELSSANKNLEELKNMMKVDSKKRSDVLEDSSQSLQTIANNSGFR